MAKTLHSQFRFRFCSWSYMLLNMIPTTETQHSQINNFFFFKEIKHFHGPPKPRGPWTLHLLWLTEKMDLLPTLPPLLRPISVALCAQTSQASVFTEGNSQCSAFLSWRKPSNKRQSKGKKPWKSPGPGVGKTGSQLGLCHLIPPIILWRQGYVVSGER